MKTGEILRVSDLLSQYAASGYATNPKYYQIRFEEKVISWKVLALWLDTQDSKKEVAVFEDTKKKVLSIKNLRSGRI